MWKQAKKLAVLYILVLCLKLFLCHAFFANTSSAMQAWATLGIILYRVRLRVPTLSLTSSAQVILLEDVHNHIHDKTTIEFDAFR